MEEGQAARCQAGLQELPDVGGRQGLQLPREEQLPMPQLMLKFLRQVHHLGILYLLLHFP